MMSPLVRIRILPTLRPSWVKSSRRAVASDRSRRTRSRTHTGSLGNGRKAWLLGIVLGQLIEEEHIEQRLMHLDAAVVGDEAELAKAIHEKADTGPCGADHLR